MFEDSIDVDKQISLGVDDINKYYLSICHKIIKKTEEHYSFSEPVLFCEVNDMLSTIGFLNDDRSIFDVVGRKELIFRGYSSLSNLDSKKSLLKRLKDVRLQLSVIEMMLDSTDINFLDNTLDVYT